MCRLKYNIPYSGKLSREKTFANFTVLWLFVKVFSAKFGGVALWCCKSEQFVKVFFAKIVFFTNLRKFSSSKVSCYMVSFICAGMIHGLNPLCLEVMRSQERIEYEYLLGQLTQLDFTVEICLTNCITKTESPCRERHI